MPNGGKLILATSNFHMDEDFVRHYPYPVTTGDYLALTVSDTGVGMDAATRLRVFEPFFTTKEKGKGTGLGLSMVYGVVKQSGGYIDLASEPNAGATFKIYLPKALGAVEPQPETEILASSHGIETILLVEDEPSLRGLARHQLESCGYRVLEASSATEAFEVAGKHDGPIHLLLTDVVMPGMNGRLLAQELTRHRPHISVVYMSGYTGQVVGADGVLDEGVCFLPKPFTRDALAQKIREALEGRNAAGAAAR
jgi:CheY-like chemotaxis protein